MRGNLRRLLCLLGVHRRSAADRTRDRGGLYRSVCKRCGVPMVRTRGTGRWLALTADRDRRARTRPLRRVLDQMTGPVLFVLLLAVALGLVTYLRGQGSFWR